MKQPIRVAMSLSLLAGALLILQFRSAGEAVPVRKPLETFPATVGAWQGKTGVMLDLGILHALKPTDYVMRRYEDPAGRSLWIFIGYWESQRKGVEPHSPKNCLPSGGWELLDGALVTVPLPAPATAITVNRYLVQKDREQMVVFYWYHSQGQVIAGEVPARIAMVKSALVHNRTDGAIVRVMSPIYGSARETSDRLVAYVQAMYPLLGDFLPD